MDRVGELLAGRCVRIVFAQIGVVRLLAVGAPVPLVLAGVGIIDHDAMIAVAVGDEQFIGLRVNKCLGDSLYVVGVIAALALPRLADLKQKFSRRGEFQD